MTHRRSIVEVDRREVMLGSAAGMLALLASTAALAQDKPAAAMAEWEAAMKKLFGDAKPVEGKVKLDMPEIAENGNTVPFTVNVDSPMTDADYVKSVHVFSTGNPQPVISSYYFTPQAGKVSVAGRMRLAKTQDIVTVAQLSDGKALLARRTVKVTIGGCGG